MNYDTETKENSSAELENKFKIALGNLYIEFDIFFITSEIDGQYYLILPDKSVITIVIAYRYSQSKNLSLTLHPSTVYTNAYTSVDELRLNDQTQSLINDKLDKESVLHGQTRELTTLFTELYNELKTIKHERT